MSVGWKMMKRPVRVAVYISLSSLYNEEGSDDFVALAVCDLFDSFL